MLDKWPDSVISISIRVINENVRLLFLDVTVIISLLLNLYFKWENASTLSRVSVWLCPELKVFILVGGGDGMGGVLRLCPSKAKEFQVGWDVFFALR